MLREGEDKESEEEKMNDENTIKMLIARIEELEKRESERSRSHKRMSNADRDMLLYKFASEVVGGGLLDLEGLRVEHLMGACLLWCSLNGEDASLLSSQSNMPLKGSTQKLGRIIVEKHGYDASGTNHSFVKRA